MYAVERQVGKVWVLVCTYSSEETNMFADIASSERYAYRIMRGLEDVTSKYRRKRTLGVDVNAPRS